MQRHNFWFILAGLTSVWWFAGGTRADEPKAEPDKRPRLVAQLGHCWCRLPPWRSRRTASRC